MSGVCPVNLNLGASPSSGRLGTANIKIVVAIETNFMELLSCGIAEIKIFV